MTVMPYMGVSLGFIVGPLLVPTGNSTANHTNTTGESFGPHSYGYNYGSRGDAQLRHAVGGGNHSSMIVGEEELNHMLIWHTAAACALLVAMVLYFPAKPAVPPSKSAAARAESHGSSGGSGVGKAKVATIKQAFHDLGYALAGFRDRDVRTLWVISIVFALPLGVYSGWGAVLGINLKDVADMSSIEAGKLLLHVDFITLSFFIPSPLLALVFLCPLFDFGNSMLVHDVGVVARHRARLYTMVRSNGQNGRDVAAAAHILILNW